MKIFHARCAAALLALAAAPAPSQDLSPEQGAELRSRADGLVAQRQKDPGWDGGTRRITESRGDVKLDQNRGEVKTRTTDRGQRKKDPVGRKMKRAASTLAGALVRKR